MSSYPNGTRKAGDVQIAVFQYVAALAFLWLLSGFWQLQVQSPNVYAERADRNRIKSFKIPVSDNQAYRQFGNAVVVPVVKEVAKAMVKQLTLTQKKIAVAPKVR